VVVALRYPVEGQSSEHSFDDDAGCDDADEMLCTEGAGGPLCGTCV
jgi:hypothetical protein